MTEEELVGLRLLLAEDDDLVRRVLVASLESWQVTVDAFADGALARTALADGRYDVLVTDLKMPGVSGLDLLAFARERQPQMALVVITGFTTPEAEAGIAAAGALLLRKPFNADEFRAALSWGKRRFAGPVTGS